MLALLTYATGSRITGINLSGDDKLVIYRRCTVGILLNGFEIFPEAFPAEYLMSGAQINPNDRFYELDLELGAGKFEYRLEDRENLLSPFPNTNSYQGKITLRIEVPQ